jgi:hypothetical protein
MMDQCRNHSLLLYRSMRFSLLIIEQLLEISPLPLHMSLNSLVGSNHSTMQNVGNLLPCLTMSYLHGLGRSSRHKSLRLGWPQSPICHLCHSSDVYVINVCKDGVFPQQAWKPVKTRISAPTHPTSGRAMDHKSTMNFLCTNTVEKLPTVSLFHL